MEASGQSSGNGLAANAPHSRMELVERLKKDSRVHAVIPRSRAGIAVILNSDVPYRTWPQVLYDAGLTALSWKGSYMLAKNPGESEFPRLDTERPPTYWREYPFVFTRLGGRLNNVIDRNNPVDREPNHLLGL